MNLAELGEFGFIDRVRARTRPGPGVVLGIGDDCAALELPAGELLLTTSDLLIEAVHFRREWTSPLDLGHKSAAVNISDIAAMGGTPRFMTLALGVPGEFPVADLEELVAGFAAAAETFGAALTGGDTCRSPGPLLIAVTAEGSIPPTELVRRSGARPGDGIYVSGTLGDSALALRLLQEGRDPGPALLDRHRRPEPRVRLGRALAAAGLPSAMIDLSDGLLADCGHILAASGVGARIEAGRLPFSAEFRAAHEADPDLLPLALAGGEDYELLFTVPAEWEPLLLRRAGSWEVPVTRIGTVTPDRLAVLDETGRDIAPSAGGFNHFSQPDPDRSGRQ